MQKCRGYFRVNSISPFTLRYHDGHNMYVYDTIIVPCSEGINPKTDIKACIEAYKNDSTEDYFVIYIQDGEKYGICVTSQIIMLTKDFCKKDNLDDLLN